MINGRNRRTGPARDPRDPAEWQEAANLAKLHLRLDSARMYGLIDGGPPINAGRCQDILRRAAEQGVHPLALDKLLQTYIR